MDYREKSQAIQSTPVDVGYDNDPFDSAKSNSADRRDMARMGKAQELNVCTWSRLSITIGSHLTVESPAQFQDMDDVQLLGDLNVLVGSYPKVGLRVRFARRILTFRVAQHH